nr:MAG TPA: hypothetical protein [Caudoviricetes sp.]
MKAYRKSYHLSKGYPGYPVTMPSLYRIKKIFYILLKIIKNVFYIEKQW